MRSTPALGVPAAELDSLPALDDTIVEDVYVGRSLQHQVIAEYLQRADRALYLPDAGSALFTVGTAEDVVKAAATKLTEGAEWRAMQWQSDLFSRVNAFASLSYERAGAEGHLVIAPYKEAADRLFVRFQHPVPLRQARSMRKLLELSDNSTSVFVGHKGAYGLGSHSSAAGGVEISITGHAEWELSINGSALLRVTYGHAALPRPLLRFDDFSDTAERILGTVKLSCIWAIVQAARGSGHGTALVVSGDPEREAARLGGEAVAIDPAFLEPAEVVRLSRVDGAILLGPRRSLLRLRGHSRWHG